jgi:hypothetical protein
MIEKSEIGWGALKDIGCRRDGCYAIHFEDLGAYPHEIAVSAGATANLNHVGGLSSPLTPIGVLIGIGALVDVDERFYFSIANGVVIPQTLTGCTGVGLVVLAAGVGGDTPTKAPTATPTKVPTADPTDGTCVDSLAWADNTYSNNCGYYAANTQYCHDEGTPADPRSAYDACALACSCSQGLAVACTCP